MRSNWEKAVDKLVRRKVMQKKATCPRTMRAASALITNLGKRVPPHPLAMAAYSSGQLDKCSAIEKKVAKAATAAFGLSLVGKCDQARKHLKGALRMDRVCRRRKTGSRVGRRRLRSFVEA